MPKKAHAIRCPACGSPDSRILDSRRHRNGDTASVYRRRTCAGCGWRWSTYEVSDEMYRVLLAALHARETRPTAVLINRRRVTP